MTILGAAGEMAAGRSSSLVSELPSRWPAQTLMSSLHFGSASGQGTDHSSSAPQPCLCGQFFFIGAQGQVDDRILRPSPEPPIHAPFSQPTSIPQDPYTVETMDA